MRKRTVPRVAVVDGDSTNCMLLREICQAGAWDIAGCASGVAEGVALVERTRPDCLITEYRFAGPATGLELIAAAKQSVPQLFTVMVTGWDINDVAARVTAHQPDRIMRKPVPPHTLLELLGSVYCRMDIPRIDAV